MKFEDAAKKTVEYLYSLSDDCPPELAKAIDRLRQIINEEFIHSNKTISSQIIWDLLKESYQADLDAKVREARVDEITRLRGDTDIDLSYRRYNDADSELLNPQECGEQIVATAVDDYLADRLAQLTTQEPK